MKKVKGLLVIALVLTIFVGNIMSISVKSLTSEVNFDGGMYTTLEEPDPKGQ